MRTTIDLEDALLREAKVEAVKRGITLRELMTVALQKEIHPAGSFVPLEQRVSFPLFKSKTGNVLNITSEMIKQAEFEDDLQRSGLLDQ